MFIYKVRSTFNRLQTEPMHEFVVVGFEGVMVSCICLMGVAKVLWLVAKKLWSVVMVLRSIAKVF